MITDRIGFHSVLLPLLIIIIIIVIITIIIIVIIIIIIIIIIVIIIITVWRMDLLRMKPAQKDQTYNDLAFKLHRTSQSFSVSKYQ